MGVLQLAGFLRRLPKSITYPVWVLCNLLSLKTTHVLLPLISKKASIRAALDEITCLNESAEKTVNLRVPDWWSPRELYSRGGKPKVTV